jgi:signal transduction histidine kinase
MELVPQRNISEVNQITQEVDSKVNNHSRAGETFGIWQKIVVGLIALNVIIVAGLIFFDTGSTVEQIRHLTSEDGASNSFALAEKESLTYLIELERWSVGLRERRDVEMAKGMLARTLSETGPDGNSLGALAGLEYSKALRESDEILQSAVPGLLPVELQKNVQSRIEPIVTQMLSQTRAFVHFDQIAETNRTQSLTNWARGLQIFSLLSLLLTFGLFSFFAAQNVRNARSNLSRSREVIESDTKKLNLLIDKLSLSEATVISLRALSEAKSSFIENVNHELRTPLSSVIGHIDIIRDATVNKPELGISKSLEVLDRNANILLMLIDNVVSLTKLDLQLVPLPDVAVDIAQVLDDCILVLQGECESFNIDINLSIDRDVGYLVKGDVEQLNRAFVNVLSNSVKFSDFNSHIDIAVEQFSYGENWDTMKIFFRDYGIGIPAQDIGKVFRRFYRGSNARKKQFPGTGLGMAIVSQIVHFHGGAVEIESVEGEGTTITVILPKHLSSAEELVRIRRHAVLVRTITELQESSQQDLPRLTHTLGGLIGFYTFEEESKIILGFSMWLDSGNFLDPIEIEVRRKTILKVLNLRLASMPQRDGANE